MRGLLRNNFYVTLADAKAFAVVVTLLGVFVVAMDNAIPSRINFLINKGNVCFKLNTVSRNRK